MKDINDHYDKYIFDKMSDENEWPEIENTKLIGEFIKIANKQFSNNNIEGYLSSTLIFHQIIEELLINLLKLSNLYIQAEIWPTKLNLKIKEKLMFGEIIREHDRSIKFDKKTELIDECRKFNEIRIKFVHNLLKFKNETEVKTKAKSIQEKFRLIIDLYFEGREHIEYLLFDLQKRIDWDLMK
ncbi:hypothetical protein [Flavobacterium sp. PL002]|uniref:hypothetical protein n=1 Tax=Flavobacterium sp. PL002 TaxID=1897058 RepID=UPI001788054C|nr:hypothetical protein [Flavobacterium sp. PL002]MBE0391493.1 hypothetical protein [Flavobacterium sp. PL002]